MGVLRKNQSTLSIIMSSLTLLIVIAIITISVFLVRNKLLKNAQDMGMALVQSYAMEEETTITMFKDFLDMGSQYVNELSEKKNSEQTIQLWMKDYFSKLTHILGEKIVDPYAVIDDKIIAQNAWAGDQTYRYQDTRWYQQTLENPGQIMFTDAYQDVITNETIITASIALENEGDVLAMDIYPSKIVADQKKIQSAYQNSFFYMSDSKGQLIYALTPYEMEQSQLQEYNHDLFTSIQKGEYAHYDDYYVNQEGKQIGVYYYQMDNGWIAIMTIPFQDLLMDESNFLIYILVVTGIIFIIILFIMIIKNVRQLRKIRRFDQIIQILSESYYAMYRIHIHNGTYEVIKTSPAYQLDLPKTGPYQQLLKTVRTVVEQGAFQEFSMCFSLESIRGRVQEGISDYGGDFKRRFEDDYRWVNVRTLYNQKISRDEVILCFKDVDVEKRQELGHMLLLQRTLETNKKNIEAKTAFFNHMSHDMRTPLNAIIGFSKLALKHLDESDKIKDYLKKISYSGNQLLALINDILELSKMEAGQRHLDYKTFDIEKAIHETWGLFEERMIEEKKVFQLHIDIQNTVVIGDEFKIHQILNNLLSNAVKYSESGDQITLDVKEMIYQNHHKIQFVVEDTGIGMSQPFLEHLFEPYARETHFSVKSTIGTGLGMPIVKSLVEQMSGKITVESELGKGTKFTVMIPFEIVQKQEDIPVSKSDVSLLKGKRVLLVEDNDLNMEIASEMLKMNDMEVITAKNGQEALHVFETSPLFSIDMILMDMQMPVMDGCQATEMIRQLDRPDAKTVMIIALTANAFSEDVSRALRVGMNAHVSKPIRMKVLNQVMSDLLSK